MLSTYIHLWIGARRNRDDTDSGSDSESKEDDEAEPCYDENGSSDSGKALLLLLRRRASHFFRLSLYFLRLPSPWPSKLPPESGLPPSTCLGG